MRSFYNRLSAILLAVIFVWMSVPLSGQSTCVTPTEVTVMEITNNSALVTWDIEDASETTQWYVFVYPSSEGAWNGYEILTSTNSVTLTDLIPSTYYTVRVQTFCGEDDYSEWTDPFEFNTDCGLISVTADHPYQISFEDSDAGTLFWPHATEAGNGIWMVDDGSAWHSPYVDAHSGYYYYLFTHFDNGDTARLFSPFFDLTQLQRPEISFWHYENWDTELFVYYRTGMNGEWQPLAHYSDIDFYNVLYDRYDYLKEELRLPAVDSCQLSFVATYVGTESNSWGTIGALLDDISLYEGPSCHSPVNLSVDFTSANHATLSWTDRNDSEPASWTVRYKRDIDYDWTEIMSTDTFVTFDDLTLETHFMANVKANCGANDESEWSADLNFYTSCGRVYTVSPDIPYQQGFEDRHDCWSFNGYNTGFTTSWLWAHSGHNLAYIATDEELLSPYFDLTQLAHPTLTFHHRLEMMDEGTALSVYYRTGENEPLQLLAQYVSQQNYSFEVNALPADTCQIVFRTTIDDRVFIDDIMIGEMPSCIQPNHLSVDNISTNSVTLSWNANGNESEWTIHVTGRADTVVSSNPVTLNGLLPNSTYYVSVRANCGGSDFSAWTDSIPFQTECGAITIDEEHIYTEGFENCTTMALPMCWENVEGYSFIYSGTNPTFSGRYCLRMSAYEDNPTTLHINEFTNEINTLQVSFSLYPDFYYGGDIQFEVGVLEGDNQFVPVQTVSLTNTSRSTYHFPLNRYDGEGGRIAFRMVSFSGGRNYLVVDNIVVEPAPTCPAPTNVTADEITSNSAVITWLNGSTTNPASWTVRLNNGLNDRDTTVTTNSVVFSNLAVGTRYTVQVRANCTATDISDWSNEETFDTECGVIVVTPDNPYMEGFEVYPLCWHYDWDVPSRMSGWDWDSYAHTGDGSVYTGVNIVSPILDLTALETPMLSFYHENNVGVYYRTRESGIWQLLADFPQGDRYGYKYEHIDLPNTSATYEIAFGALYPDHIYLDDIWVGEKPECLMPTDIDFNNLTSNSVQISWTANGEEDSWTIRMNGNEIVVTENPVTITDLEMGTRYVVSVRANCTDTTSSDWSEDVYFSTYCDTFVVTSTHPYHEGFEGYLDCWDVEYLTYSLNWWQIESEEDAYEGTHFVETDEFRGGTYLLFTPILNLTQVSAAQINFQTRLSTPHINKANRVTMSSLQVFYRTDRTSAWQLLETYNDLTSTYARKVINLPELSASCQIGFMAQLDGTHTIILDDINVFELLPCAAPSAVTVEDNVVTWTGTAPSYNVKVSVNGEVATETTVTTNNYTVEGLEEGDYAIVRVQAVCNEDNLSEWTEGNVVIPTRIENYGSLITIHPNPTTGVIRIEGATPNADLAVFDVFGKRMMSDKVTSELTELDLSGLAAGVYVIRIANAGEVTTVKVVKE